MRRIELIADIQGPLKTNNLGNGLTLYPDHVNSAANADHGRGSFHLKRVLLEFHQVFGEHLELSHRYLEFRISRFLLGIELKFVQMNFRLLAHGHIAAIFEFQPQS